jgi:hypothetical protein
VTTERLCEAFEATGNSPLNSPPRVSQARFELLRAFAAEQLHAIAATAKLAATYGAVSDGFALTYLAQRIAAHSRALDATVDDISALEAGGAR